MHACPRNERYAPRVTHLLTRRTSFVRRLATVSFLSLLSFFPSPLSSTRYKLTFYIINMFDRFIVYAPISNAPSATSSSSTAEIIAIHHRRHLSRQEKLRPFVRTSAVCFESDDEGEVFSIARHRRRSSPPSRCLRLLVHGKFVRYTNYVLLSRLQCVRTCIHRA